MQGFQLDLSSSSTYVSCHCDVIVSLPAVHQVTLQGTLTLCTTVQKQDIEHESTIMSNESSKPGGINATNHKWNFLTVFNTSVMVCLLVIKSVPWMDVFFAIFASVFVYTMSRVAYPTVRPMPVGGWRFPWARFLPKYMLLAAVIGLLLPLLQIFIAFVGGDQTTVRESAPHLFLLCAQVLTENLTASLDTLAHPIKGLIPALYNAHRLISLSRWAVAVFSRDVSSGLSLASSAWGLFGRSVVVSNVLIWHFNLWCFLLPVYVPWTLRTHYTGVNALRDAHIE